MQGERGLITFERRFVAPIEKVWAALTDPAQLAAWFTEGTLEPHVGGRVTFWEGLPGQETTGRVLLWDPPRTLEYEWRFEGEDQSIVRYELASLSPEGTGTRLTLTHRALGKAFAAPYMPGWHAHLDRLVAYVAYVEGQALPDWGERYASLAPLYRP